MISILTLFLSIYAYIKTNDEMFLVMEIFFLIVSGILDYLCILEILYALK